MRPFNLISILLVIALALPTGADLGQTAEAEGDDPGDRFFTDTVKVNVVNVDVYVTDKKGERITGLTRDDFVVYEDKRQVEVTNFFEVREGRRVQEQVAEDVPVLETDESAPELATGPEPVDEEQRLYLVVYIDNYNIRPPNRNRVMRELRVFLDRSLDQDDRVMLVTYDRSLNVRRQFTSDARNVASALRELERLSGHAVHRESERRDAKQRIEESESINEALSWIRTYAASVFNDLAFTIDAMRETVDGLVGLPGRKAILYVSEGIPMIAGEDMFHAIQAKFNESSSLTEMFQYDASRRFRELAAAANAGRVSFYTIDAAGLRTYSYADASVADPGTGRAGSGALIDQVYYSSLQSPLQFLAEKTGGKAIINTNRVLPELEKVAGDFDTYYSLGYRPAHSGDGRLHRIKVELKNKVKGYRIRHRENYRDKPTHVRMADSTVSALLHSFEDNKIGANLGFGNFRSADKGNYLVPIVVSIPIGKMVLVPTENFHEARLALSIAVIDSDGGMSEVQHQAVPVSIPAAEVDRAKEQDYQYGMQLLMRPGLHRVAVGIRDEIGSEVSYVSRTLEVGPR